jgi:hypothetical protein
MSAEFAPLPCRRGRIAYRSASTHGLWGIEDFRITHQADGGRTLMVECQMRHGAEDVTRFTTLAVDAALQPVEAHVRILNHGRPTGSGWFHFTAREAEAETATLAEGRLSQRRAITRPMRGFGIHALIGDGWLAASFPFERGPGHTHFWGPSLLHSLHHFGATGPMLVSSTSGLRYEAREAVTVPAGTFDCHRLSFQGMTNNHPPYTMWISADDEKLYVKGHVAGYMDGLFQLETLDGNAA